MTNVSSKIQKRFSKEKKVKQKGEASFLLFEFFDLEICRPVKITEYSGKTGVG